MSDHAYYLVRATTIDGPDFEPGETVKITLLCQVVPMGDGSSPMRGRHLHVVDFGGPVRDEDGES